MACCLLVVVEEEVVVVVAVMVEVVVVAVVVEEVVVAVVVEVVVVAVGAGMFTLEKIYKKYAQSTRTVRTRRQEKADPYTGTQTQRLVLNCRQ